MKRILFSFIAIASLSLIFSSCEDDTPGGGGIFDQGPTVTFESVPDSNFLTDNADVEPGSTFSVRINAVKGDSELNTFTLTVDGVNADISTYVINGNPPGANPALIFDAERDGLTWDITVTAQSELDIRDYVFSITDDNGNSDSASLLISTETASAGDGPPVVNIGGSGEFTASANSFYSFRVLGATGDNEISIMTILEDGDIVDPSRLSYDETPFDANPFFIPAEDRNSFSTDIVILTPNETATFNYEVILADDFGNENSAFFSITTGPTGEVVTLLEGVLFNAAGPVGTGGLDLETGMSTGSSDPLAEIRDEGIDDSAYDINWIKRIAGVNGTEIRSLFPGQNGLSENFTFTSIEVQEQLPDLWGNAFQFQNSSTNGDYMVSFIVEVGDMFIAQKGDTYYSFRVIEVNDTPADNGDNYVLDIKF